MNIKTAAGKWDEKMEWIEKRCVEGMIPFAEHIDKNKKSSWDIPSNAEKPPCTAHQAVVILENLLESASGKYVNIYPPSMKEEGKAIIQYLSNWGFITTIDSSKDFDEAIKGASVLERGVRLISETRQKPIEEIETKYRIYGGINTPFGNIGAEYSKTRKTSDQ